MRRVFAVVLGVVASCQAASCLAALVTFKASSGPINSPDANSQTVNVWTPNHVTNSNFGSFSGSTNNNGDNNNNGSAGAGPGPWWILYAFGGGTSSADASIAPLAGRNLGASDGDYISIDFDNGSLQSGAEVGVSFYDGSGNHQLTFRAQASDTNYEVVDDGGVLNTGIPRTDNGFTLTLSVANATGGYALNVFNTQTQGAPINTTIASRSLEQNSSTIAMIRVYDINGGAGTPFDVFFNNLTINASVPETSAALAIPVAVVVSGAGAWARRRFRSSPEAA